MRLLWSAEPDEKNQSEDIGKRMYREWQEKAYSRMIQNIMKRLKGFETERWGKAGTWRRIYYTRNGKNAMGQDVMEYKDSD